jgi:hypothetical protein
LRGPCFQEPVAEAELDTIGERHRRPRLVARLPRERHEPVEHVVRVRLRFASRERDGHHCCK